MATTDFVHRMRAGLGPVGVFQASFLGLPLEQVRDAAKRIEVLGYGSLFVPEALGGREAFALQSLLLSATGTLRCGTAIANLWCRHPAVMEGGATLLSEAHPDRFLLGIGVSHAAVVGQHGVDWSRPLDTMRDYLAGMDAAATTGPATSAAALVAGDTTASDGPVRTARLLAALGPKMLELAATAADGAIPYLVPPEHTASARKILGPDRLLIVEQAVAVEPDRRRALELARGHVAPYLHLPNYAGNLARLGFESELAEGGSDRLVRDLVATGAADEVAERVRRHLDAGADHVLLQPVGEPAATFSQLEELAPYLV